VSKQARVKEEVVVKKDAEQRTEKVSDKARHTEVKVEDQREMPFSPENETLGNWKFPSLTRPQTRPCSFLDGAYAELRQVRAR
jgi:hypothetical protein